MAEKVIARFIIEIAGKPVENVEKALNLVLKKINDDKRYKVVSSDVAEPILDEETTLYGGFLDIEIKFAEVNEILGFILDYTPSSVEVIEPEKISLDNNYLTGILNDMSLKLLGSTNKIRQLNAHIHMLNKKFGIDNSKK